MGRPKAYRSGSGLRIELMGLAPSASPTEAAAMVAALERFLSETRPSVASAAPTLDPWCRAALLEGVSRERQDDLREPWI